MFKVDAGQLNRRIQIERNTGAGKNAVGEVIPVWTVIATVWAQYTPVSDGEKMNATEQFASIESRFIVRWSSLVSGIKATDQIIFDGKHWNILGVKEIERRRWLEITAGARDDQ